MGESARQGPVWQNAAAGSRATADSRDGRHIAPASTQALIASRVGPVSQEETRGCPPPQPDGVREYLARSAGSSGIERPRPLAGGRQGQGFDKTGTALDNSFVQLNKYLESADVALDLAIAPIAEKPKRYHKRLYPAGEWSFGNLLKFGDAVFLKDFKYDESTYPIIHDSASANVAQNRLKDIYESYEGAVGVFRHTDHDIQLSFNRRFAAHYSGQYRLKFSVWGFQWDKGQVKPARGNEVVGVLASGRILGYFDAPSLKPTVHELEVWLNKKETIELNAASLWPSVSAAAIPNSTAGFTAPGIAFDWLEIDGPVNDGWPAASHRRLFGDLPLGPFGAAGTRPPRRTSLAEHWFWPKEHENDAVYALATVASQQPATDAERLMGDFLPRAFRRPVAPEEVRRYVGIVKDRLAAKDSFEEAMRTACKAALCSTRFLYLQETPGKLDDWAAGLAYILLAVGLDAG